MDRMRVAGRASIEFAWLLFAVAIVGEIVGTLGLRLSQGFALLLPTTGALAAFALALFLVSKVMQQLPLNIAYPVWAGAGTAGVALVAVLFLHERAHVLKGIGIMCVIAGIVLLNRSVGGG